jgi:hypothetical protein
MDPADHIRKVIHDLQRTRANIDRQIDDLDCRLRGVHDKQETRKAECTRLARAAGAQPGESVAAVAARLRANEATRVAAERHRGGLHEVARVASRRLHQETRRTSCVPLLLEHAAELREREERAEAHRVAALQPLSERLAEVVLREIERQGRALIKSQLADALHADLLSSGLARDPRRSPSPHPSRC